MDEKAQMIETVRECQAGNKEAFGDIIARYQSAVYTTILGYVRSNDIALDLTHDVFLRVYRYARTLRTPQKLPSWIMAIARHTALNYLKRSERERTILEEMALLDADCRPYPQDDIDSALKAIEELPEMFRTPFLLKYLDCRSLEEIADLLHVPQSTVVGRLYQARTQLKKKISLA